MLIVDMLRLLVLFGAVSALDPSLTFHYVNHPRVFRRNEVACQVCYGEFDCLSMAQCSYNAAAAEIMNTDDGMNVVNEVLTTKVDSMMYDLILEDSLRQYNECIPLISSYTTCNKDNICLGCKSCDCDENGRWNCSDKRRCSATLPNIDHGVLTSVVDVLRTSSRYKRSYDELEESSTTNVFEDLNAWIYVTKPEETYMKGTKYSSTTAPTTKSGRSINDDNDSLAFDDILSNDNLDQWIRSAEKTRNSFKHKTTDTDQFLQILKNIEEGIDDKLHIDKPARNVELLKDLKQYLTENSNNNEPANSSNDQPNSVNAIITDTDDFGFEKQQSYMNSVATVVKRNAKDVNETTKQNETTHLNNTLKFKNEAENISHPEKELQHIIDVLNVLINNERKEINHLNYVKDNLLKFSRKYKNYSNLTDVIRERHNISNDNSVKYGDWKIDMLSFYLKNLKKDVKDTMRDIYAIQKLINLGVVPLAKSITNLRPLLIALTSYYLKNSRDYLHTKNHDLPNELSSFINTLSNDRASSINSSENGTIYLDPIPQRRVYEPSPINIYKVKLIKRALTRILVVIDNDTPSTFVLSPLKSPVKNILNRIVVQLYKEPPLHPSIRDPNFNVTKILTTVTAEWQNVPIDVHKLNPADRLLNMKLLHLTLSKGIDKLENALMSVQFGYSRRMTFIQERVGKGLVSDASKYLSILDNRIKNFVLNADITKVTPKRKNKEKKSMWHHIKNAFAKSKNGLVKYFQNKLQKPKSYIVNDMVKKRVEDVNKQKFLEVMKRWQENFDNYQSRQKRSVKQFGKRMKDIVPKYLRKIKENTKINPAFYANKLSEIRKNEELAWKSKYKLHANKITESRKDKVHTERNKIAGPNTNKIHSNVNLLAGTRKTKVNKYADINKNNTHRNMNGLVGLSNKNDKLNERTGATKNKVHTNVNVYAGTSKNKNNLHVNMNKHVGFQKTKLHTNGNNSKNKRGPKQGNTIELKKSTAKRGVRTQGYH